jgi:hypothetical protein
MAVQQAGGGGRGGAACGAQHTRVRAHLPTTLPRLRGAARGRPGCRQHQCAA